MKPIRSIARRVEGGAWTLVAPLVLAVFAGLFAWISIRSEAAEARAGWELEMVLVAAEALPAGRELRPEDLARREIPVRFVSSSVVRPEQLHLVVGQRLQASMQPGDPLLWVHLEAAEATAGLARLIQRPGRAVTIPVGDTGAVGGWVEPNDHVDVIATFREEGSHELAAVTLLQNVLVLATGGRGADVGSPGHVTLLVLPEEAEMLILAQQLGTLGLALRNPDDLEMRTDKGRTTARTLLTGERAEELRRKRHATIQVIRGNPGASLQER